MRQKRCRFSAAAVNSFFSFALQLIYSDFSICLLSIQTKLHFKLRQFDWSWLIETRRRQIIEISNVIISFLLLVLIFYFPFFGFQPAKFDWLVGLKRIKLNWMSSIPIFILSINNSQSIQTKSGHGNGNWAGYQKINPNRKFTLPLICEFG